MKSKIRVMLETGGSPSITNVPAKVIKIIDLKCPKETDMERERKREG